MVHFSVSWVIIDCEFIRVTQMQLKIRMMMRVMIIKQLVSMAGPMQIHLRVAGGMTEEAEKETENGI